jgi:hypothetical protein
MLRRRLSKEKNTLAWHMETFCLGSRNALEIVDINLAALHGIENWNRINDVDEPQQNF